MCSDHVLVFLVILHCKEVNRTRMALREGFISNEVESGEMLQLSQKIVPTSNRVRSPSMTIAPVNMLPIPILYRSGISRVTLESVRRNYKENRGVRCNPNAASGKTRADGVNVLEFYEQYLPYGQAENAAHVTEEALTSAKWLILPMVRVVPVSINSQMKILCCPATKLKVVRCGTEAKTRDVVYRGNKTCEVELKVQLLANKVGLGGNL